MRECIVPLTLVSVGANQLDDDCIKSFGDLIQQNQQLIRVGLDSTKISDRGIEILSDSLEGNITLRAISLSENKGITDACIPFLVKIVNTTCVTNINVRNSMVSNESLRILEDAIRVPFEKREIPVMSNSKSAAKAL